ncbi:MAG: alkaline phosphatase family protein, partial [Candidatus Woesearchaeota archaeon]
MQKKLQLDKLEHTHKKFVAIQIDGLSYNVLKKAMDKGYCRFIKSLIEKERMHFTGYNCGIPSGTPGVQASIFYGENRHIPAFRFIDKKEKQYYSFARPGLARLAETNFFAGKKGMLEGGASYSNILSGGAERSIFTMSTITATKRFKRIKESDLWLFMLLNPLSLTRVIYYTFSEISIEMFSVIRNLFRSRGKGIYEVWIPFRRWFMNAILAEMITLGVTIDLRRGVPKIYMTYINYDDVAHWRGPESLESFFTLRSLDRRIKRMYRQAKGYDFYVLSDHGQQKGIPFKVQNDMELTEFIQKCTNAKTVEAEQGEKRTHFFAAVMQKTVDVLQYASAPLRWVVKGFAQGTLKLVKGERYPFDWDDKKAIFVIDSCCVANIYFNSSNKRLQKNELEKMYPHLIDKVVSNRSVGMVMVQDRKDALFVGKKGSIRIRADGSLKEEGEDILSRYGDKETLIKQLKDFSAKSFLGDLVLFGNVEEGFVISFTDHVGCHGGIGGDMTAPFVISKDYPDLTGVIDSKELHKIFSKY